ncbi:MAG: TIGR02530 family flagellar biosynthesis protein [Atribacterota bacterium]
MEKIGGFRSPEVGNETLTPLRRNTFRENSGEKCFEQTLREEELKFSVHAQKRIQERSLVFDQKTMVSLRESLKVLENKGARNSLVMVGNTAFVVNVPNRLVVTCFDHDAGKESVFTNIDSAVII